MHFEISLTAFQTNLILELTLNLKLQPSAKCVMQVYGVSVNPLCPQTCLSNAHMGFLCVYPVLHKCTHRSPQTLKWATKTKWCGCSWRGMWNHNQYPQTVFVLIFCLGISTNHHTEHKSWINSIFHFMWFNKLTCAASKWLSKRLTHRVSFSFHSTLQHSFCCHSLLFCVKQLASPDTSRYIITLYDIIVIFHNMLSIGVTYIVI